MIRVLHSVSYMHRAGVETFLMNYYRYINRDVVQFDFLCNKELVGCYDEEIKKLGGRLFYRPNFEQRKEENYALFWKEFLNEHPEIDILHAHNGAKQCFPLIGAKNAKFPIRIAHAHSTEFVHDDKYEYRLNLIKQLPEVATHFFGCSNMAGDFFFGKRLWNEKGVLIRNAIPSSNYVWNSDIRKKGRDELDLGDCFVIGNVGRFQKQKNHERLVDIFSEVYKKNNSSRLILIGTGKLEGKIKEKTKKLGLEHAVIFLGEQKDMSKWYQVMDVYVMPSFFEGLTLSGIEAQASGLPCVFSDVISRETKMTEDVRFISLDKDNSAWAEEILSYEKYKRKNTQKEIINAGYDVVLEAKKLEKLYVEIIKTCFNDVLDG